ncbi:alpha/beta hydrolase [Roseibium marinum]|nr:alpha/beta hydrolase [Roseibium marinum]
MLVVFSALNIGHFKVALAASSSKCEIETAQAYTSPAGCTAYKEIKSSSDLSDADVKRAIIMLHGDMSRSDGEGDYMFQLAMDYADRFDAAGIKNYVFVVPIRRGYGDGNGNRSSGKRLKRDGYRKPVVDQEQAFLAEQRERFSNAKVTIVGHSGGAAIAGVIAGRAPSIADSFVLVGTPWNIQFWRRTYRKNSSWPKSLSPHNFIEGTSTEQAFYIVAGLQDTSTPSELAKLQAKALEKIGRNVQLLELDAKHNQLMRRTETIRLIAKASSP